MPPVEVKPNPYHPTRDIAILREPWTVEELVEATTRTPRPLSNKAVAGTSRHDRLMAAGGRVYQQCPPQELDAGDPAVSRWCERHATLLVETCENVDLPEVWTSWYEVIHAGWAPTAPHEQLRDLFGPLVAEISAARSTICRLDGEIVAVAFVFEQDDPREILTEAMLPKHPQARKAVASCLARTLRDAPGIVRFDGHVSDPHFYPLLQTLPGVYAGSNDPLDLIEIGGEPTRS